MNVPTRMTRAELAEKVKAIDTDIDVVNQIVNQLRRLDGWHEGRWSRERRQKALDLAARYLELK